MAGFDSRYDALCIFVTENILVLGAGAVVEAVLPAILGEYPASISLVNRDINKALQIGARFPIMKS